MGHRNSKQKADITTPTKGKKVKRTKSKKDAANGSTVEEVSIKDKREDVEQMQNGQAAETETKEAEASKKGDTDSTGSGNAPTEIVEDSPDKETQKVAQLSDVQSPSEPSTSPVEVKTPEGNEPNKTESVPESPQATEPAKAEPEAQPLPVSDSQPSNEVKNDSKKEAEIKEIVPEPVAEIKSEPVVPAEPTAEAVPKPVAETVPEPVAETTPEQVVPAPVPEPVKPTTAPEPVEPTPVPEPVEPAPVPEPIEPTPVPEPVAEPSPAPEPVAEPSPAPEPVAEPIPAPEPVAEPPSAPEPVAESVSASEPVAKPTSVPEPVAEPAPEAVAEAVSEPVVAPVETAAEQVVEPVPSEAEPVKKAESPVESKSSEQEPIADAKAVSEVQLQSSPVVEAIPEAVVPSESVPEIVKGESQPEPVHELGTQNEPSPVAEETANRNSVNLIQTEVEINSQSPTEISNSIESEKLNGTSEEPQVNGVESELMNGNCSEESNGIVNSQLTENGPSEVATMISWKNGGETVVVCGDFCNWEDGHSLVNSDGVFSSKIKLRKGQNHYKFIVDGKEMIDENAPIVELEGHGQVNLLVVPAESD